MELSTLKNKLEIAEKAAKNPIIIKNAMMKSVAEKKVKALKAEITELENKEGKGKKEKSVKKVSDTEKKVTKARKTSTNAKIKSKKSSKRKSFKQTGNTSRKADKTRAAKPVGYRFVGKSNRKPKDSEITKGVREGKIYFEGRRNRSDKDRKNKFEEGGVILAKIKLPNGTKIQSILFDKKLFNEEKAENFMSKHDLSTSYLDDSGKHLKYRQSSPSNFKENSFKTISIEEGVKARVAVKK